MAIISKEGGECFMRILYISPAPFIKGIEMMEVHEKTLIENFKKIARHNVTVDSGYLDRGTVPTCYYFEALNTPEMINKVVWAEKEGYDAAMIGCYLDPGLKEAREIVKIPVTGAAESSMILACMLGLKFSIISTLPKLVPGLEKLIRLYGFESRTGPVRSIDSLFFEIYSESKETIKQIMNVSKKAIEEDGAEVIIVGCTVLGTLLTKMGISEIENLRVPVIDPVAAGIKMTEILVDLKDNLGLKISRRCLYEPPTDDQLFEARKIFGFK